MARPRDRDEAKTEKLNMRVTPSFKKSLEAVARLSGKKAGPWAEDQLVRILEENEHQRVSQTTPETRQLLETIEQHIFEIERATGTPWHQGLGTWAVVREMLNVGPIMAVAPEPPKAAAELARIEAREAEVKEERSHILDQLAQAGVPAVSSLALLGVAWLPAATTPTRDSERTAVEALADISSDERAALLRAIDELEQFDVELVDLQQQRVEAVSDMAEAIEKGRATYERPQPSLTVRAAMALADAQIEAIKPKARRGMFGAR